MSEQALDELIRRLADEGARLIHQEALALERLIVGLGDGER